MLGTTSVAASQTVNWTGNGLDSVTICVRGVDRPSLHWVLTPGGSPVPGTTADLYMNGVKVGTMSSVGDQGALQLTIRVSPRFSFESLEHAVVYAVVTSGSVGDGAVLTISDGCVCKYSY
jgi:hypothetical protein